MLKIMVAVGTILAAALAASPGLGPIPFGRVRGARLGLS